MSQYEQENDLGGGGGEVDAGTEAEAWASRDERSDGVSAEDLAREREEQADETDAEPWAKFSSGRDPDDDQAA